VVAALLAACGGSPEERVQARLASAAERMEGYFPNTLLVTDEAQTVRFYDDLVKGKTVLINFMYAGCQGICPRTMGTLAKVQEALGDRVGRDVFIYSLTLDPEHDTPEVLRRHAQAVGAGPGWRLLTGRREDLEVVRRKVGLYDPDPAVDADMSQHGGLIVYGNEATGRWSAIPGLLQPASIVRAVRLVMSPAPG
jgi:protein SCO1/2